MISLTNFNYTFPGEIVEDIMFKPLVATVGIAEYASVHPNVKFKKQLTLSTHKTKLLKKYSGCGTRTLTGGAPVDIYNRTLETFEAEMYDEQCKDTFEGTFLGEFLPAEYDANTLGEAIRNYMVQTLTPGISNDMRRQAWGASAASPSADYDLFDGWFTLFINNPADIVRVDNITVLDQNVGTRTLDYLRNLTEGADPILKQVPMNEKVILVSGNHYENLMTTLEDSSMNGGGLIGRVENGVTELYFRGIKVVAMYDWDTMFDDVDFPHAGVMNNAIVYTLKENLAFAIDSDTESYSIGSWYDRNERLMKFEAQLRYGVNYVFGGLSTWSYGLLP